MQTTGQTTSAGGTGMNTAVLAGGLPPGFDPQIWAHGSYLKPEQISGPERNKPCAPLLAAGMRDPLITSLSFAR
jgi:hypothetical protein